MLGRCGVAMGLRGWLTGSLLISSVETFSPSLYSHRPPLRDAPRCSADGVIIFRKPSRDSASALRPARAASSSPALQCWRNLSCAALTAAARLTGSGSRFERCSICLVGPCCVRREMPCCGGAAAMRAGAGGAGSHRYKDVNSAADMSPLAPASLCRPARAWRVRVARSDAPVTPR